MTAPLTRVVSVDTPAAATTITQTLVAGRVPFAGTVTEVIFIPHDAFAAISTHTRSYTLRNRGQTGAATVAVAALTLNSVAMSANVPVSLTLSATTANLVVASGDVLDWDSAAVSSGAADPGGMVMIKFSRS